MKVFIQSNKFQKLAAKVARYSFIKNGFDDVEILDLESCDILNRNIGKQYLRNGKLVSFEYNDLQSFTLLRFLPPKIQSSGFCLVIDPDIFAIKNPLEKLRKIITKDVDIFCTEINNQLRSEVMILNLENKIWDYNHLIEDLFNQRIDYSKLLNLSFFKNLKIKKLDIVFNHHDKINEETIFLHTSNRITQPWKEGLNINFKTFFTNKYKILNLIKYFLRMNYDPRVISKKFLSHPNINVNNFIIKTFNEAIKNKYVNKEELDLAVMNNYISTTFKNKLCINE